MVATNSMATRSSLELMLDKLQKLDDRSEDVPPALPVRPVSRARLPRPRRRPLQLDSQKRNSEENDAMKEAKKGDFTESFHQEDGGHFPKRMELSENSKEIEEKEAIKKIQEWYRGHRVECYYKQLRKGVNALQSFIRGENARRDYQCRSRSLEAIILIQNQTRKYFQRRVLEEHHSQSRSGIGCSEDQTRVPYSVLVDLEKQVLRSEAKVREKKEQNAALKRRVEEMEKKWRRNEERMRSMEKEWQDQFTYIQECLAASKNNTNQNPNERILDIPMINSSELVQIDNEQTCLKINPHENLRRLKHRFKVWKKEYKNKLRDVQSTFKKIVNSQTAKSQKNWWGRLSH